MLNKDFTAIPINTLSALILAVKLSNVVFIMLINVEMPTILGILTVMSMINFVLN